MKSSGDEGEESTRSRSGKGSKRRISRLGSKRKKKNDDESTRKRTRCGGSKVHNKSK